ncbi:hypothetical protein R1T08_24270 [Streptomyces sp. SBC-4]|nr:hypothetical protein [Streptomyces sp. SBC-4]MDV5147206.1 hypothetical protein [Streptomyces sp. SBC-4]
MNTVIPATPGWYVRETDDEGDYLDPVIAWLATVNQDGDDVLLPFVNAGPGDPPFTLSPESFKDLNREVVYRPGYNPTDN